MYTLLVVEDELDVSENIAEILRTNSYKVMTASNGIEAMQKLDQKIPDLIISDIIMPGMDGTQLLEFVQNSKKYSSIPFIFLTARSSYSEIREGMLLGADDYLAKPFRAKELLNAVEMKLKKKEIYKGQLNKIRENIAFSIQHELRTPLTPILGFSDLLVEYSKSLSAEEIELMGASIKQSANRLISSVEKFILFSNLQYELNDSNSKESETYTENIKVLAMVLTARELELKKRQNEVTYSIEEAKLKIDEKYFTICIRELIENAIKFSQDDSKIRIVGNNITDYYEISIENGGSWLSPEQIANITILNKQNEPSARGSGLGIPIVLKIIQSFGGSFEIISEKDQYTKVILQLPIINKKSENNVE